MKAKLFFLLFILSLWTITNSFGYEVTSREVKSFKMMAGGDITVIGDEGYIKVKSWDKDEVNLVMTKRAWAKSKREAEEKLKRVEIEIEQTRNQLYIRQLDTYEDQEFSFWDIFDPDRWGQHRGSTIVDFELTVPQEVNLYLETDEGDIDVADIKGDLDIDVDEGEIQLKDIEFTDINITIDEGDLDCYSLIGSQGHVTIDADEGNVRLEKGQIKKIKVDCDEGDILLRNIDIYSCDLSTDEGDIDANVIIQSNGKYYMYSDEGDITVFLPQNVNLSVKLETDEGRIYNDFDLDITELEDGERARGKIGEGDAKLEAYTDEGDIALERR